MKRLLFVLFATTLLAGCNREFSSKDFTHTGCNKATETKADAGEEVSRYMFMPVADYLILKYEGGDLRVIRRNLHASCGVKTEGGLICEVSLEGNTVHYLVYETHSANCACDVNEMTSAVTGLQVGKQYIFQLNKYKPVSFTFTKDLFLVQDELSLMGIIKKTASSSTLAARPAFLLKRHLHGYSEMSIFAAFPLFWVLGDF